MIEKLKACIDKQIEVFKKLFLQELGAVNAEILIKLSQPYPLFDPMTPTDIAYQYFNKQLDYEIRNTLLSDTFTKLFQIAGFPIRESKYEKFNFWDLESQFLERREISFVFTDSNGNRIGVKFDTMKLREVERESWFERYGMDELYIIRLREESTPMHPKNLSAFNISEEIIDKISYHPIESFVRTYFGQEVCDYYVQAVRKAIVDVREERGFSLLPRMGQKQSYWTKLVIEETMRNLSTSDNMNLDRQILAVLDERVFQQGRYQALMGQEDFARSFLTAEFFYHHIEKEAKLDLTTIITGYMKSLEQFLYHLLQIRLKQGRKDLWITSKNFIKSNSNYRKQGIYNRVRLEKSLEESFKTDLGSLICFIDEDEGSWLASDELKKQIIHRLQRFNKQYRNTYLHKNNLYDLIKVEEVRSETFRLFYFLFGVYRVADNAQSDVEELGGVDYSYNRLYQALSSLKRSCFNFRIGFTNQEEPILCLRVRHLDEFEYDEQGHIQTPLEFIKTDRIIPKWSEDYSTILRGKTAGNTITLNKDNLPIRLDYYDESQEGWISVSW